MLEGIMIALLRHPGAATAYIYLRYEYVRGLPRHAAGDRRTATPPGSSARTSSATDVQPRHLPAPRRGGVHLRRRDRADREPRRQAGLAADQAAVPGRRRRVPQADGRQQRRDARLRARTSSTAAPTGSSRWASARPEEPARRRQLRAEAVLHRRARQQAGLRRAAAGRHLPRADRQATAAGVWKGRATKAANPGGISMGFARPTSSTRRSISQRPAKVGCSAWAPPRSR